jgi:hypothetical protein
MATVKDQDFIRLNPGPDFMISHICFVGGPKPYLWIGGDGNTLGTIDRAPQIRKLRDFCDAILAKKR